MDLADCKVEDNQVIELYVCVCVCVCVCEQQWLSPIQKHNFQKNLKIPGMIRVLSMPVSQDWYEYIRCEWCKMRNVWATFSKFCW